MATLIDCPNHNGNYDCTTFCSVCEGNQVYDFDQLGFWEQHKILTNWLEEAIANATVREGA